MKASEILITPIAIDDAPLRCSGGLHAPYALRTIVEVRTDNGLYGVGEVPGSEAVRAALAEARSFVLGWNPFELNRLESELYERFRVRPAGRPWTQLQFTYALSALEVALLDIVGKQLELPVSELLGGRVRDKVPFSAYIFYKYEGAGGALGFGTESAASGWTAGRQAAALNPDGIVQQAKAMCAEFGFDAIKLKGGVFPPEQEFAALLALRDSFGADIPLRFDPNAVWRVDTAILWGRRMEGLLEYFEDPVDGQVRMGEVRRKLSVPLATNMCTTQFEHLPQSVALGSEQVILCDHHSWGGLRRCVGLARICATFDRGLSMHSNSHLGISLAAMTHLAAALPNLRYASDTHYPWQRDEVIKGGRWRFRNGMVEVPTTPGLGVELDREALDRLHQKYIQCGLRNRNDESEMQKIEPGWRNVVERW